MKSLFIRYPGRSIFVMTGTAEEVFEYTWTHDLPPGAVWWSIENA
jgi:hypothetical protein